MRQAFDSTRAATAYRPGAAPEYPGAATNRATPSIDPVAEAARTRFGVEYLFPYQRLVIANVLEAAHASRAPGLPGALRGAPGAPAPDDSADIRSRQLVILPTGSGKSLCFQLPAVLLPGVTVVVYPLLSLIADQKRRLEQQGIACVTLTGRSRGAPEDAGAPLLVLTNPESLRTRRAQKLLDGREISHLVIDEAHCVAEWGETFRPAYLELGDAVRWLAPRVVTGFTATASPDILRRIDQHLFEGEGYHLVRGNPDRPNIRYAVAPVASRSAALRVLLYASGPGTTDLRPAVVFCRTRGICERTALELRRALDDSRIRFYHAGLSKPEKKAVEEWFLDSRDGVLVATCAYGMGVDKKDIRTVIHRDLPPTVESYLQESGRAGRDGEPAQAVVLASPREMAGPAGAAAAAFTPGAPDGTRGSAGTPGPLTRYVRGDRCRREVLVEALGAEPEACSGCDVCDGVARVESPVAAAISGWLRRRRRRYTPAQAAAVLAGTARTAPVPWHPAREPVFGLLEDWPREEIDEALEELRAAGRLEVIRKGPWRGRMISCSPRAHRKTRGDGHFPGKGDGLPSPTPVVTPQPAPNRREPPPHRLARRQPHRGSVCSRACRSAPARHRAPLCGRVRQRVRRSAGASSG